MLTQEKGNTFELNSGQWPGLTISHSIPEVKRTQFELVHPVEGSKAQNPVAP